MNDAYFKDVVEIGDLFLDKVFNEFEDENIVFVCKDAEENRYLCVCYEIRFSLKWILCPVSNAVLIDVISNKIDLKTPFLIHDNLYQIIYDGENERSVVLNIKDFDNNLLPNDGTLLKPDDDLMQYVLKLGINAQTISKNQFVKVKYNDLVIENLYERIEINSRNERTIFFADISIDNKMEYRIKPSVYDSVAA